MQLGLRRPHRNTERVGDLIVAVPLDVLENEDISCPIRQAVDRALEIEGVTRRPASRRHHTGEESISAGVPRLTFPLCLSLAQDVIDGEPMQPRPELRLSLERLELVPGADEDLLCEIFRGLFVDHANTERVHTPHVFPLETFKRLVIAVRRTPHIC